MLHHSATERGDVASIDRIHRARTDANGRHWLGIGYHFVVGNGHGMDDGEIEPTFRWRQQLAGAHAGRKRANEEGIGVCVIGNCERQPPTARQIDSAERLIAALVTRYELDSESVIGHDAVLPTSCPGRYFPLERLKQSASRAIEVQDVPGGASAVPANMPTNALTHRTAKRVR